ncbi:uncharacterized protein LOC142625065 [Castanea sativa]|uniref:uncharacterized protein LOC142625065 n=1 Tax=Castanea sativa TaxID=21020 RepID=UPI003F652A52
MMRMFRDKIGRTVEVYIDDMVIKSKQEGQHVDDLKEVFEILRRHRLRLNADKCAFGVGSDKFLGYLIIERGIEVSPDQIEAAKRLKPPGNPKEVQKLTGMLAALNRFISKFANRCQLIYQLLKKWKGFRWDEECDRAFQDLKDYLGRAPTLSALEPGEDLYMYLSVSEHAANVVLLRDNGAQLPVYYISKMLVDAETRLGFRASNNEAEYEALLAGLRVVMDLGAKEVEVYSDSFLVVSQVQGNFEAKDPRMIEYLQLAKQMMGNFVTVKVEQIAWGQNRNADSLATLASSIADEVPWLLKVELVPEPSIAARALVLQVTEAEKCWMDPIIDFLLEDRAPKDEKEAARSFGIRNRYSTLAYHQSNGQAEATNKAIVCGLKKRLEGAKGRWAEELPSVLWAYQTTLRRSTGETPFSVTYGAEAVIPAEVNLCSARVAGFASDENEELMARELNLLKEHRDMATIRLAEYQQKLARRYNRAVRRREFAAGDLVL